MNDEYKKNLLKIRDDFRQKAYQVIDEISSLESQFPPDVEKIKSLDEKLHGLRAKISEVMEFIHLAN